MKTAEIYLRLSQYIIHNLKDTSDCMEIVYDPETDSMDIEFQKGKYEVSKEIAEGIIIDYTKEGKIISIEILNASERMSKESMKGIMVKLPQKA